MIRAEGISRRYFRQGKGTNVFMAVEKTDLMIPEKEMTVVMGRSGSGKSTLLNMLAGLLEPTEGHVYVDETDLYALSDDERARLRGTKLGIIPQGQTALRALTVLENILLPVRINRPAEAVGAAGDSARKRAMSLLEEVGIAQLSGVYPDELSGGERRRLAIARALILQPGILLADEPTADLDDENTEAVLKLLRRCADRGMGVFLVTHEPDAKAYADRIFRMNQGVLGAEGTSAE